MSRSSLSVMEAKLPPGFRFHPRDDELICDYLMKKITLHSSDYYSPLLIEVDLNKCEPWDIPEIACVGGKEWYFYSQRDRKYATGLRTNRATISGYWKATGKDRPVVRKASLVGMRKTLVFYQGRAPKGRKTNWVMHEFRLEGPFGPPKTTNSSKEDWVLCRVFNKNREVSPPPGSAAAATAIANKPTSMESNNSYEESGSSSLPALMDSYITFDQNTPYYPHNQQSTMNNSNPTAPTDNNAYQHVPCFSIFSPINNNIVNQTDPALPPATTNTTAPTYLDQLQEQNNMTMSSDHRDHKFDAPNFPSAAANHFHDAGGGEGNITINPLSCDKDVIKAVLDHLTKMNNNNHQDAAGCSPNIRGRSSPSFGEAASSSAESYLSDVANLPAVSMWTNNY